MARDKGTLQNINKSDLPNYPNGRIKDNTGNNDGTPVNEFVYGDIHELFARLMRRAGILYNGLPDNVTNKYQLEQALVALPTKNDFILDLTSNNGRLNIPIKLGILESGESFVCRSTSDYNSENEIVGTIDNTTISVIVSGNYKMNEYVRLVRASNNITLIRIGDSISIDAMVGELGFLKAASNIEELDGLISSVATTPMGNLLAFVEWVNGVASSSSLASAIRNGLYPKEHFQIVENIGNDRVRNIGWVSGLDPGGGSAGSTFPVSGNFSQCSFVERENGATTWEITLENPMDNTNYFVRIFLESLGDPDHDDDLLTPVFIVVSATRFRLRIDENSSNTQSVKAHMETVQIN